MSYNIIDDFRQQYELALDEIYDLQAVKLMNLLMNAVINCQEFVYLIYWY